MASEAEICDNSHWIVGRAAGTQGAREPTRNQAGNAMKRRTALGAVLALLGSVSFFPDAGQADEGRCAAATSQHLASLGIEQAEVQEISIVEQSQFVDGEPKTIGYQAWVGLSSCSRGKLVIKMSLLCQFKTAFTTSGCEVAGVCD